MSFFDDEDVDSPSLIPVNPSDPDHFEVDTPSGANHVVVTAGERDYYLDLARKYQEQNKFTNISDLADLDRLIANETMIWRWQQWLSREQDYWNNRPDLVEVRKYIKDFGSETRLLKKQMGLDKASRDKASGIGSVSDYIETLKMRGREFGIKRNEEAVMAITLWKQLESLIILYDNATPEERQEMHIQEKDIISWARESAVPMFNEIDKLFRGEQKYWIVDI